MTALLVAARDYRAHGHGTPADTVRLTYEARFLRRRVVRTDGDEPLLIDLAKTTSLDHGGVLLCDDGREIAVVAEDEPLLEIRGTGLTRLAWHIGNRHTPCQIEPDRLLIQPDHVIRAMLERLGAEIAEIREPFTPEGGAYGHGRTHAHDHGHTHEHGHGHTHP